MADIYLNSSIDLYYKDESGNKIPHFIGNQNNFYENIKNSIKNFDNFLFITSNFEDTDTTDKCFNVVRESFDITFNFKNYDVLDIRTESRAKELVDNADFIFLSGGHCPTQRKYFDRINLKDLIKNTNAVLCGASAGSMALATTVYCPPELEGEALDKNFQIYYPGLDKTNINILPHYSDYIYLYLDGFHYLNDIIIPHSYTTKILAINDCSYVLIKDNSSILYGEGYIIENGITTKICENGCKIDLKDFF